MKPTQQDCCRPQHPTRSHGKETQGLTFTDIETGRYRKPPTALVDIPDEVPVAYPQPPKRNWVGIFLIILTLATLLLSHLKVIRQEKLIEEQQELLEESIKLLEPKPDKQTKPTKSGFGGIDPRLII